jgi:hypothetical protein
MLLEINVRVVLLFHYIYLSTCNTLLHGVTGGVPQVVSPPRPPGAVAPLAVWAGARPASLHRLCRPRSC